MALLHIVSFVSAFVGCNAAKNRPLLRTEAFLDFLGRLVHHGDDAPQRPYDLVTRVTATTSKPDSLDVQTSYRQLPLCNFSTSPAKYAPWTGEQPGWHAAFLDTLNSADVTVVLTFGSLLGAYRHHGTLPYDEDMDMVFSLCENIGLVSASGGLMADMTCEEISTYAQEFDDRGFYTKVWEEVLSPLLAPKGIKLVDLHEYGLRLSNGGNAWNGLPGGIGVDLHVTSDALSTQAGSPELCKCTFGSSYAYCSRDSKAMLIDNYGEDFMTPKSQCDYYKDIGHAEWSWRSKVDCAWAANLTNSSPSTR